MRRNNLDSLESSLLFRAEDKKFKAKSVIADRNKKSRLADIENFGKQREKTQFNVNFLKYVTGYAVELGVVVAQ